jgi:SAM-dependent methyltransferase
MSTDAQWEQWGVRDPYYGVLTDPRFRATAMNADAKREFFASGGLHVDYVLGTCRGRIEHTFAPQRVLDFGCGVGRLLIPFAQVASDVVGMDIAPSMLAEARINCEEHGITNVSLLMSDDTLSKAEGQFDLVHSCIVLQHVEIARGRALFAQLVNKVKLGGCGAIHVTFGWDVHASTFGLPPPPPVPVPAPSDAVSVAKAKVRRILEPLVRSQKSVATEPVEEAAAPAPSPDPEMQMNYYNLSELMFIMQGAGIQRFHSEFTDHGGALGVFLFFQKPVPA